MGNLLQGHLAQMYAMDVLKGKNNSDEKEDIRMETKSRYEVIADLERNKRDLILEKDSFDKKLQEKQKDLKDMKRNVEDAEEDIKNFEESIDTQKETIDSLIVSVNESLKRFDIQGSKK